ncbi:unnamed protein product, partial [Cylicocyclus nassatus]
MSGSYLVKNTAWSFSFLQGYADYISRLPNVQQHGTDNGALHAYLAELIAKPSDPKLPICFRIYNESSGFGDLFLFEACIREVLGNKTSFGSIKILPKGTAWARDPRMTNSKWSPDRDFMIHNWKTTSQGSYKRTPISLKADPADDWYNWYNPIVGHFDLELCKP